MKVLAGSALSFFLQVKSEQRHKTFVIMEYMERECWAELLPDLLAKILDDASLTNKER